MATFASFYQRIIDPGASQRLSSERPLAGLGRSRRNTFLRGLLGASIATFGLTCAGTFNAQAANFTCSWNYATANWTTAADWSNCNGTDPNNSGGNTYDVIISTGDPTLTTSITSGSVTINSPGAWSLSGSGANATLTGTLTTSGDLELHQSVFLSTGGGLSNSGALNLDTNHLEGGSSLAIGGTLNNSTTINVGPGDHTLTASSTVSAAALGQVGTINLDGVTGGAQAALKIAAGPVTITSGRCGAARHRVVQPCRGRSDQQRGAQPRHLP